MHSLGCASRHPNPHTTVLRGKPEREWAAAATLPGEISHTSQTLLCLWIPHQDSPRKDELQDHLLPRRSLGVCHKDRITSLLLLLLLLL